MQNFFKFRFYKLHHIIICLFNKNLTQILGSRNRKYWLYVWQQKKKQKDQELDTVKNKYNI